MKFINNYIKYCIDVMFILCKIMLIILHVFIKNSILMNITK